MKILDQYLLKQLIIITIIVLLILLSIFSFLSLIDQLEEAGRGSYDTLKVIQYVTLTLPRLIYELLPIAAIIASMTTLGILSHNSELVVIRTSGISLPRLAYGLSKGALVLIIFSILLGEFVAPYTENYAQKIRSLALTEQIAMKTKNGFWSRDGNSYINIRKILPGEKLADINIYEFDDKNLRMNTHAESASFVNGQWLLENIEQTVVNDNEIKKNYIKLAAWESLLSPDVINLVTTEPQYLTILGLVNYIKFLHTNEQNSQRYEQALWTKIFSPLTILAMVLLAVPIVKSQSRLISVGQRVFTGCLLGILFHIINQISSKLGIVYALDPVLVAIAPTLILLTLTVIIINSIKN